MAKLSSVANNALSSLSYPIDINCRLSPVLLASREGAGIYRRSLCFLAAIAAREAFPGRRLVLGHSLGHGYLYYFDGQGEVAAEDLAALGARLRELASTMRNPYGDYLREIADSAVGA